MPAPKDFAFSPEVEPHKARTKAILKDHPEVRTLIGRNPWSALIIASAVALQLGLAFTLREQAWWVIFLVAYGAGAFANHAM